MMPSYCCNYKQLLLQLQVPEMGSIHWLLLWSSQLTRVVYKELLITDQITLGLLASLLPAKIPASKMVILYTSMLFHSSKWNNSEGLHFCTRQSNKKTFYRRELQVFVYCCKFVAGEPICRGFPFFFFYNYVVCTSFFFILGHLQLLQVKIQKKM